MKVLLSLPKAQGHSWLILALLETSINTREASLYIASNVETAKKINLLEKDDNVTLTEALGMINDALL